MSYLIFPQEEVRICGSFINFSPASPFSATASSSRVKTFHLLAISSAVVIGKLWVLLPKHDHELKK